MPIRSPLPLLLPQARTSCPQKVALINMPWAACNRPSIQCGLLKAMLSGLGHTVDIHYLNLELAAEIGSGMYAQICDFHGMHTQLIGEWLFATSAFGNHSDEGRFLDSLASQHVSLVDDAIALKKTGLKNTLLELKDVKLPAMVDKWAMCIDWASYDVIGFSSTFEQNVASIALAKKIKERSPQSIIVFGGANLDGDMGPEYIRAVPSIDYVVVGEGDIAFPRLIENIATKTTDTAIPGVCRRRGRQVVLTPPNRVQNLDSIPPPDYTEYFQALAVHGRNGLVAGRSITLPYESARGCWWGEKHHCTFCGLNNHGMQFRAKTAERVLKDIEELTSKYHILNINFTDNILDMHHIGTLMPLLADKPWDLRIFYEVKANLTREHLKDLRRAGVLDIQPGIESLNSHVLSLMRKGSTLLLNLRVLKWAQYYGIRTHWSILMGFPGERDEDYIQQITLIPLLSHLMPPNECGDIWLERFSPYFTDDSFPINDVRPVAAYEHIYPREQFDLDRIAYFFSYQPGGVASRNLREKLSVEVGKWIERWQSRNWPTLDYECGPGWVRIRDNRNDPGCLVTFEGWRSDAFLYCGETARTPDRVSEYLSRISGIETTSADVLNFVDECVDQGFMVTEEGRYFNIALPRTGRSVHLFRNELTAGKRW
jgi:ribosomal peptide maturation radical SAM protein 1